MEVESAAARALKGRVLNRKACGTLLRAFARDLDEHLIALPVASSLILEATVAARHYAVRSLDAVHMAAAAKARNALASDALVFVASDRELLAASRRQGWKS